MLANGENFMFRVADGTVKLSGRGRVFRRTTPIQDHHTRGGEEYNDDLQGESDGSQLLDTQTDDGEARRVLLTIPGTFIVLAVEPGVCAD